MIQVEVSTTPAAEQANVPTSGGTRLAHQTSQPTGAARALGSLGLEPQRRRHRGHCEGCAGARERTRSGLYQSVTRFEGPRNLAATEPEVVKHVEPQLQLQLCVAPCYRRRARKVAGGGALGAVRLPEGVGPGLVREVNTWLGWRRRSCAAAVCTLQISTERCSRAGLQRAVSQLGVVQ